MPLFQRGGLFGGNDGVFIEAAAAAGFGGVGQLAAADAAHGFGHNGSGEQRALSQGFGFGLDVAVVQLGLEFAIQCERYRRNHEAAAGLFEHAVAIGKTAVGTAERYRLAAV